MFRIYSYKKNFYVRQKGAAVPVNPGKAARLIIGDSICSASAVLPQIDEGDVRKSVSGISVCADMDVILLLFLT